MSLSRFFEQTLRRPCGVHQSKREGCICCVCVKDTRARMKEMPHEYWAGCLCGGLGISVRVSKNGGAGFRPG
ncbi:hypothetical protein BV25DRAFT_1105526 [Artomyces pyxidatus]|uniref:Uncharacterized protein n=1 Tax=Artomyces pyxidatus TaxID=48021 RepID=A0ACB8TG84_9AGAM|nr:hypothetical protein BV25DRAFT_1105526 [Artomyces pyxidatus]